jgi:enoyl-CoA hydratase
MEASDWQKEYQHLLFDHRRHGVLLVTMNRPERANAMNPRLHDEMATIWHHIDLDPTVAVAVLTGAGKAFCSGGEVGTFGSEEPRSNAELDDTMHHITSLVDRMVECRKPIVSAVNGLAMASGLAVALAADISVVAETAKLDDGHLKGGMVAGDHATLLWPLYMSLAKARYYLLTGYSLTGKEAERIGLASVCVPDGEVLERALEIADRIATSAQYAVRWTKKALNAWVRQQAPLFELATALQMLTLDRDDMVAAMESIAARRPTQFPSVLP